VALANPFLPTTRIVFPSGWRDSFNITTAHNVQPPPYPEGFDATQWGDTWVRLQGAADVSVWREWPDTHDKFGIPEVDGTQYIVADQQLLPYTEWGKPRMSPHTIWATLDTPQQAIDNNHGAVFYELDTHNAEIHNPSFGAGPGPWWGTPYVVTPFTQTVLEWHDGASTTGGRYGKPSVESTIRTVQAASFTPGAFGWPFIPTARRQRLLLVGHQSEEFGVPDVSNVDLTQTVYSTGSSMPQFGTTVIDLKNRPVYPQGFSATLYGNNFPMVHFPRRLLPPGLNATQWGSHMAAYRIRYLQPVGSDQLVFEDSPEFDGWLTISHKTNPLFCEGLDSSKLGVPDVRLRYRYIRPYMIQGSRCMGHGVTVTRGS
jgi:hypothetical protein